MEKIVAVAVKGIVSFQGKVLIIQRTNHDGYADDEWEFPGGKMEFGEDIKTALLREIKEETGLTATINKLAYATTFKTHVYRQIVILAYLCTAQDHIVTLSNEHKNYIWADQEQMRNLLSTPIINDLNENSIWDCLNKSL